MNKYFRICDLIKKEARKLQAMPHVEMSDKSSIDLHFEFLDNNSIKAILKDIERGENIYIPNIPELNISKAVFNIKRCVPEERQYIDFYRKKDIYRSPSFLSHLKYNPQKHSYELNRKTS